MGNNQNNKLSLELERMLWNNEKISGQDRNYTILFFFQNKDILVQLDELDKLDKSSGV